eukprot:gene14546-biopygen18642
MHAPRPRQCPIPPAVRFHRRSIWWAGRGQHVVGKIPTPIFPTETCWTMTGPPHDDRVTGQRWRNLGSPWL